MKVLLVEDEIRVAALYRQFLSDLGEITIAVDGVEALRHFEKSMEQEDPYEVLITDLDMPIMSGAELIEKVNELDSEVFKIVVTGTLTPDKKNVLKDLGVRHFFKKPVDFAGLLDVLYSDEQSQDTNF